LKPPAALASCFPVCSKELLCDILHVALVLKVLLLCELRFLTLHFEEPVGAKIFGACFKSSTSVVQFPFV
jgi:hypothetical protein